MSPLHASALKLRTSSSMYSCSSPLRYRKSAKRCAHQSSRSVRDERNITSISRLIVGDSIRFCTGLGAHLDGHVGDCEEIVEFDAKSFVQLFLVLGFQCRLSKKKTTQKKMCVTDFARCKHETEHEAPLDRVVRGPSPSISYTIYYRKPPSLGSCDCASFSPVEEEGTLRQGCTRGQASSLSRLDRTRAR